MALNYDAFSFKRVVVEAHLWPPPTGEITVAELSRLLGNLNDGELFTNSEFRPSGATFTGEYWSYDLNSSAVLIRCFGYRDQESLYANFRRLLDGTRAIVGSGRVAFYASEIRAFAEIPEDGRRDIGEAVQKKLLRRAKPEELGVLPGLMGAGLSLMGYNEAYGWRAEVDTSPADNNLHLFAGLTFNEPEPPRPGSDLEVIESQIRTTCEFVQNDLQTFAEKFFT